MYHLHKFTLKNNPCSFGKTVWKIFRCSLTIDTKHIFLFIAYLSGSFFVFTQRFVPLAYIRAPSRSRRRKNGMRIYAENPRNSLATNRPETAGSCSPEISKRCFTRRPTYPAFPFFVGGNNNFILRSAFIPHNFLRAHVRSKNWTSGRCVACITIVTGFGRVLYESPAIPGATPDIPTAGTAVRISGRRGGKRTYTRAVVL